MFQVVVLHHAVLEHRAAFAAFMHRVVEAVGDAPGLIEFSAWDAQDGPLVAVSRWESAEAFRAAIPTIMSLGDERRPEWTARDDQVLMSVPA